MLLARFSSSSHRLRLTLRGWSGLLLWLLTGSLTSCIDLFGETPLYGPYYVSRNPGGDYYSLWYRGTGSHEGVDFERIDYVSQAGYQAGYVFIESKAHFYWFAVRNDQETDIGDPILEHLLSKPLTAKQFQRVTDSLGVGPVTFQFQE
jgi:hypothetical protein